MSEEVAMMFYECSVCKRNISTASSMWADKDKRICVCCKCFKHDESEQINLMACRRENCKLHGYRDHDYITDTPDITILDKATPKAKPEPEEEYDEKSNKCYGCRKELFVDYFYINGKLSLFTDGNFEEPESRSKIKAKFCKTCFDKTFSKLKLIFT